MKTRAPLLIRAIRNLLNECYSFSRKTQKQVARKYMTGYSESVCRKALDAAEERLLRMLPFDAYEAVRVKCFWMVREQVRSHELHLHLVKQARAGLCKLDHSGTSYCCHTGYKNVCVVRGTSMDSRGDWKLDAMKALLKRYNITVDT